MIEHPIPPLYNENSTILILGSFPSIKSREQGFFYGNPQNRFWRVLANIFSSPVPITIEEKKTFLYEKGIALWDVIAYCNIKGSSDSSITDVVANDISVILDSCNIKQIYVNGKAAARMYNKYIEPINHISAIYLPSTSPANASWSFERLCSAWNAVIS